MESSQPQLSPALTDSWTPLVGTMSRLTAPGIGVKERHHSPGSMDAVGTRDTQSICFHSDEIILLTL